MNEFKFPCPELIKIDVDGNKMRLLMEQKDYQFRKNIKFLLNVMGMKC